MVHEPGFVASKACVHDRLLRPEVVERKIVAHRLPQLVDLRVDDLPDVLDHQLVLFDVLTCK